MRFITTTLVVGFTAFSGGCTIVNEHETSYSGVWSAPRMRSHEIVREELPFYSPVGVKTAYWTDKNGKRLQAVKITDSIVGYWAGLGQYGSWPRDDEFTNKANPQHLGPQRVIISIQPTIVILAAGVSEVELPSSWERARRCGNAMASTKTFIFEYGAAFFDRPEILWFSPDLGIPPTAVKIDRSKGELTIEHPQVVIHAKLESHIWKTERLR